MLEGMFDRSSGEEGSTFDLRVNLPAVVLGGNECLTTDNTDSANCLRRLGALVGLSDPVVDVCSGMTGIDDKVE
jgi:hypothetical protein